MKGPFCGYFTLYCDKSFLVPFPPVLSKGAPLSLHAIASQCDMPKTSPSQPHPPRIAISLDVNQGFKRHQESYAGCQQYADAAGWHCTIEPAIDRVLLGGRGRPPFDGILARATPEIAKAARKKNVPLVNIWLNSPVEELPSVFPDFKGAGILAAEHLLARGFRQLAYLGYLGDIDSRLQLEGMEKVTRRENCGLTSQRFSRTSMTGPARGWNQFVTKIQSWIESWQPPIGVLVCNDVFCRYLIDICRSKKLHVSEEVAIVGTYNESEICSAPSPSLTSIDMNCSQVGYRAAALLDRLMSGGKPPPDPVMVAPAELVPRQSTDLLATDDPVVTKALRFIAEHTHERIGVKQVVHAAGINRRSLERRFRESLNRTISDEITRLRLERAKRRMVGTSAPMKDVAVEAGFRNADHFYKVFNRIEGIPPTQFRVERQKVFLQD